MNIYIFLLSWLYAKIVIFRLYIFCGESVLEYKNKLFV